jgi:hypothetical protein
MLPVGNIIHLGWDFCIWYNEDVKNCLENLENQKTGKTSRSRAPGARSRLEKPVVSVCWRGARGVRR